MKNACSDIKLFRVRNTWEDIKSQAGAFLIFENAVEVAKKTKQNVYDYKKNCVWNYEEELKNGKI
ncbi:MAG: hypothetical protein IJA44_05260 [Clostridia bacterium]|nr:hypothetical protein [Clostridia bacterium]